MYVCLQTPPPPLPRSRTETRSDGVVSAVCPPALHALLCVGVRYTHTHAHTATHTHMQSEVGSACVGRVMDRARALAAACRPIGRPEGLFTVLLRAQ